MWSHTECGNGIWQGDKRTNCDKPRLGNIKITGSVFCKSITSSLTVILTVHHGFLSDDNVTGMISFLFKYIKDSVFCNSSSNSSSFLIFFVCVLCDIFMVFLRIHISLTLAAQISYCFPRWSFLRHTIHSAGCILSCTRAYTEEFARNFRIITKAVNIFEKLLCNRPHVDNTEFFEPCYSDRIVAYLLNSDYHDDNYYQRLSCFSVVLLYCFSKLRRLRLTVSSFEKFI